VIVSRREARAIALGRQTQIRLPLDRVAPKRSATIPITFHFPNSDLGFDTLGEPKLDSRTECYVIVQEVWDAQLHMVTDEEARSEGHRSRVELLRAWRERRPEDGPAVQVRIVRFERDLSHRPRFLTPTRSIRAGRVGDYTTSSSRALRGEPEVIDEFTERRLVREATARTEERQESQRWDLAQLPADQRLAAYENVARQRHVDIRDSVRLIRRRPDDDRLVDAQLDRIAGTLGLRPSGAGAYTAAALSGEAGP
jgi:hypothetical protein